MLGEIASHAAVMGARERERQQRVLPSAAAVVLTLETGGDTALWLSSKPVPAGFPFESLCCEVTSSAGCYGIIILQKFENPKHMGGKGEMRHLYVFALTSLGFKRREKQNASLTELWI